MNNILVHVLRGKYAENIHRGHICIVGEKGKILKSIGDVNFLTYLRSCAKPIQAIPVITSGAAEKFGFTEKEITIFSGSLNGQDFQVEILESIMKKLNINESYLQCGIHPPSHKPTRKKYKIYSPLQNNCAGKHLAMLALCKYFNFPLENYTELEHPVQQLILEEISYFTEIPVKDIKTGIDGCGVPVFAVPIYNFSLAYYKLANADILDEERKIAVKFLMKNSIKYPELIAGDERICTELMRVESNIFAKVGADGSYGIAAFKNKIGIAIKIESGNMKALNVVVIELLKQLGILSEKDVEKLDIFYNIQISNHRKEVVGKFQPVFNINK